MHVYIRRLILCTVVCAFLALNAFGHTPAQEMIDASRNFLASLNQEQMEKAHYEFGNEERFDWHFIPKDRKGLPIGQMTPAQRALAEALLSSGLSQRGFARASTIMSLEQVLYDAENKSPKRNPELYYFTIFGKPGESQWGWRVEGHHLSVNFALRGEEILGLTPSFFGANPAEVRQGPRKGLRTFAEEEDQGRAFMTSLEQSKRALALITNIAPQEVITGNARKVSALQPRGLTFDKMSRSQKELLTRLLREYLLRYRPECVEAVLNQALEKGGKSLSFAWAGSLEKGAPHYYRIQTGHFLIEYDNTQNDANHVHTVWRDLDNDFGGDLLREHYLSASHSR